MDKEIENKNCQKNIKFHRLHIVAILFIVFYETGRYLNNPILAHSYLVFVVLYLATPKKMNNVFRCSERLYKATFLITALFFFGGVGSIQAGYDLFLIIFSDYSLAAAIFIFANSAIMWPRIREENLADLLGYEGKPEENQIEKPEEATK